MFRRVTVWVDRFVRKSTSTRKRPIAYTQQVTHQAVEEEVVVVSHRGIVEHRCHLRTSGVLDL